MREQADRPGLVRDDRVEPDGRRSVQGLRRGVRRRVRRPAGALGREASTRPPQGLWVERYLINRFAASVAPVGPGAGPGTVAAAAARRGFSHWPLVKSPADNSDARPLRWR